MSSGCNRSSSLTSILSPKGGTRQGLLAPLAIDGCPSVTLLVALSFYFFPRKGRTDRFPLCFASPSTQERSPSVEQDMQPHGQMSQQSLSGRFLLPARTLGSVTQPQPLPGATWAPWPTFWATV